MSPRTPVIFAMLSVATAVQAVQITGTAIGNPANPVRALATGIRVEWRATGIAQIERKAPSRTYTAPTAQIDPRLMSLQPVRLEDGQSESRKIAWQQLMNRLDASLPSRSSHLSFERSRVERHAGPLRLPEPDTTYPYADGFSLKPPTVLDRIDGENSSSGGSFSQGEGVLRGNMKPVPEPGSFLPLLLGASALISRRCKSRQK